MYILTSRLVKLPNQEGRKGDKLPLPWYHRAPLGLMSGTHVHVALQKPHSRSFGDLLVSVVDPENWRLVTEISASKKEARGVLAKMYEKAPPLNIVFAEAVTVDSGRTHDARLVVEPGHPLEGDKTVRQEIERFRGDLGEMEFMKREKIRLHPNHQEPEWMGIGEIDTGWVHIAGWREAVEAQAMTAPEANLYDTSMAVVSADTRRRLLRFVFPRRGAVSVSVKHTDRPGAMGELANVLTDEGLNILSSLLRRGSASQNMAEMVVVVEPTKKPMETEEVRALVLKTLSGLQPSLRVTREVFEAEDAVLYPRRPHEIAARPPLALEGTIRAIQETVPEGLIPIFISRRFLDSADPYTDEAVKELHSALTANECFPLEAIPQMGVEVAVLDSVKARMWASKAAILFVVKPLDEQNKNGTKVNKGECKPPENAECECKRSENKLSAFSENLAHECGFMQGQGKPLLPLVEKDAESEIHSNANLQGLQLTTFQRERPVDPDSPHSIARKVEAWVRILKDLPVEFRPSGGDVAVVEQPRAQDEEEDDSSEAAGGGG
jgi:predicted amino acid-binding ACT domain protein